jgi:arylsulfatase
MTEVPFEANMARYDSWGLPGTDPHMAVPWAWAFDTPFKWTKQVASHFGGTRQGMAMSWPRVIKDKGGIRTQFHHVIDIVPTILEAAQINPPAMVDGVKQAPIEGVSMMYTFDKAGEKAPSKRTTQYFEMGGNRGIYHEGWYAATTPPIAPWSPVLGVTLPDVVTGYKWELYDLSKDFSQANDIAVQNPEKLKELQQVFEKEAWKYQVFPLDNRAFMRFLTPRPSATAGRSQFVYADAISGIPPANSPPILGRSFTIAAEIEVPTGGAEGMIATEGGQTNGYGLYLVAGKPVFTYNLLDLERFRWEGPALAPGRHQIVFEFTYDGPGMGKGGKGVLKVDGADAQTLTIPRTIPFTMTLDETFDVGTDTRTGVNDEDYSPPFSFTGIIEKVTFMVGPAQMFAAQ